MLGMLADGRREGWVFIRHEYEPEEEVLREELERLRGLGPARRGGRRRVDIFTSPGGYILGEESALIECMEGHRGEPRNKPPFPGVSGLWGKPTLMNSVETFAHVPVIAERGAEWWKAQGVNGGTGLKFFAVSGHVEQPDVYCVPMGTTDARADRAGGRRERGARAAARSSPAARPRTSSGPTQLDVPLDFNPLAEAGSMLGSGALVVMAEGTDLLAAATNVLRFFRNESCGKCVPCRVGSTKAHAILTDLRRAGRRRRTTSTSAIVELEETMRLTSICGLGQVALGPAISVLGLKRGGTEARPHPRSPGEDHAARDVSAPGRARPQRDPPREFFTVRTVSEALAGFRPARRTAGRDGPARRGARPRAGRAAERPARPARLRARDGRRLRGARRRHLRRVGGAARATSTWPARCAWAAPPEVEVRPGTRGGDRHRRAAAAGRRRGREGRAHAGGDRRAARGPAARHARARAWSAPTRTPPPAPSWCPAGRPLRAQDLGMLAAAGHRPRSRCTPARA